MLLLGCRRRKAFPRSHTARRRDATGPWAGCCVTERTMAKSFLRRTKYDKSTLRKIEVILRRGYYRKPRKLVALAGRLS